MLSSLNVQNTFFKFMSSKLQTHHCLSEVLKCPQADNNLTHMHNKQDLSHQSSIITALVNDDGAFWPDQWVEWTKRLICAIGLWQHAWVCIMLQSPQDRPAVVIYIEAEWPPQHKFNSHQLLTGAHELACCWGETAIVYIQDAAHTLTLKEIKVIQKICTFYALCCHRAEGLEISFCLPLL